MANRIFHTARAVNHGLVQLSGFITVSSSGGYDPTASKELVGCTLTRIGTGAYALTLADKYNAILQADFSLVSANQSSSPDDLQIMPYSVSTSTKKVLLQVYEGNRQKVVRGDLPYNSVGANGGTATALWAVQTPLFVPTTIGAIQAASVIHRHTVTKDTTNYITYRLRVFSSNGTATHTLAILHTSTITLTAAVPRAMTLVTTTFPSGCSVFLNRAITGSGRAGTMGQVQMSYSDMRVRSFTSGKIHFNVLCRNSTVK